MAIENARLYSVTQQNLAGAALLNAAARTLHRTLDVKRLLPDAAGTLGADLRGPAGGHRAVRGARERAAGDVISWGDWRHEAVRALAEPLRRREAPLLIPDSAARRDLLTGGAARGRAARWPPSRCAAAAGCWAACSCSSRRPRALTEAETRLLAAYADQLAMALDNATLFEDAENQKTQLEQVFASTSDGFLVLDLEREWWRSTSGAAPCSASSRTR